jgi:hypothetical protein
MAVIVADWLFLFTFPTDAEKLPDIAPAAMVT